ncbi:MAG TPA: HD domain-containing protein [Anaerolinea sp.]|nr:HD domain-containing protein [Anaerolinea sp.]
MAERLQMERTFVSDDDQQSAPLSTPQRGLGQLSATIREWRNLRARIGSFPEKVDEKIAQLEGSLNDYRLVISEIHYKAADTDRRVWDMFDHIEAERERLTQQTTSRPLFLRRVRDLQTLNDAWIKLQHDQDALMDVLSKAPAELLDFNSRQMEKEALRQDEARKSDAQGRVAAAKRALDLAMGYIDQLNREGRVTFGSQVLQLEDAESMWKERIDKIFTDQHAGEISPDEVVLSIYNLESQIREAPNLSMRIREAEERFTRLVTKHDMLVSYGKTVISPKDIARMTIKLHEQIPQLWASGQRQELEHSVEVIESFVSTYESTVETEVTYLERRKPGLTRALVSVAEGDETALIQVGAMARTLIAAIDSRDRFMRGHSEMVSRLAVQMARNANWNKTDIDYLMIAALLHDVGKISIPEHILTKTEPLNEDEWQTIQMHPFYGAQIIKPVESLARIVPWIYHHQERWDGRGYPDHLTGRQIPLPASYISVAEAFSVMTTDLPNRPALSNEDALAELRSEAETQFSPEAVEVLADMLAKEAQEAQKGSLD